MILLNMLIDAKQTSDWEEKDFDIGLFVDSLPDAEWMIDLILYFNPALNHASTLNCYWNFDVSSVYFWNSILKLVMKSNSCSETEEFLKLHWPGIHYSVTEIQKKTAVRDEMVDCLLGFLKTFWALKMNSEDVTERLMWGLHYEAFADSCDGLCFNHYVMESMILKIWIFDEQIKKLSDGVDKFYQTKYGCCSIYSDWFKVPDYWYVLSELWQVIQLQWYEENSNSKV